MYAIVNPYQCINQNNNSDHFREWDFVCVSGPPLSSLSDCRRHVNCTAPCVSMKWIECGWLIFPVGTIYIMYVACVCRALASASRARCVMWCVHRKPLNTLRKSCDISHGWRTCCRGRFGDKTQQQKANEHIPYYIDSNKKIAICLGFIRFVENIRELKNISTKYTLKCLPSNLFRVVSATFCIRQNVAGSL